MLHPDIRIANIGIHAVIAQDVPVAIIHQRAEAQGIAQEALVSIRVVVLQILNRRIAIRKQRSVQVEVGCIVIIDRASCVIILGNDRLTLTIVSRSLCPAHPMMSEPCRHLIMLALRDIQRQWHAVLDLLILTRHVHILLIYGTCLRLKVTAHRKVCEVKAPLVSFSRFAEFLDKHVGEFLILLCCSRFIPVKVLVTA